MNLGDAVIVGVIATALWGSIAMTRWRYRLNGVEGQLEIDVHLWGVLPSPKIRISLKEVESVDVIDCDGYLGLIREILSSKLAGNPRCQGAVRLVLRRSLNPKQILLFPDDPITFVASIRKLL